MGKQLLEVIDRKEIYWRQRSKQFWLREGDNNTKYFHAAASNRRRRNRITQLTTESNQIVTWDNGLAQELENYYTRLFSSSNQSCKEGTDYINPKLSREQNDDLLKPVIEEEVKSAVFHMHPDKSPWPDGFTHAFYQKGWSIIGSDLTKTVANFFDDGVLPGPCNGTNIVIILKKPQPDKVTDLRPIAL